MKLRALDEAEDAARSGRTTDFELFATRISLNNLKPQTGVISPDRLGPCLELRGLSHA